MMEYCELHKDLSDEEGDNCPLCECMDSKARILDKAANEIIAQYTEIVALKELVREMGTPLTGKLPNEPRHYECPWCKVWAFAPKEIKHDVECFYNRPEVKAIMEGK